MFSFQLAMWTFFQFPLHIRTTASIWNVKRLAKESATGQQDIATVTNTNWENFAKKVRISKKCFFSIITD